jgi:hypothetical protein
LEQIRRARRPPAFGRTESITPTDEMRPNLVGDLTATGTTGETEPEPTAKQAEPRQPIAAPKRPPSEPQPALTAEPHGQEPKPATDKQNDKKGGSDEQKREEENRK